MSYEHLVIHIEDGIATVTINRPDKLNALNADVISDLDDWFTNAADDSSVRGVLLTGAGDKSFVAGADISEFSGLSAQEGMKLSARGHGVFNLIENIFSVTVFNRSIIIFII